VEKLWGFVVRRWLRFPLLQRYYEAALKKAAKRAGEQKLAETAIQILREGFFNEFVEAPEVSVKEEFNEFLRLLRERLPQVEGLEEFLERAYSELVKALQGNEMWRDLSKEIKEFLRQRREEAKEALRRFKPIPNHDNFLDRQSELEQLRAWLEEEAPKIGILVGDWWARQNLPRCQVRRRVPAERLASQVGRASFDNRGIPPIYRLRDATAQPPLCFHRQRPKATNPSALGLRRAVFGKPTRKVAHCLGRLPKSHRPKMGRTPSVL
jgi:hypothetical protein